MPISVPVRVQKPLTGALLLDPNHPLSQRLGACWIINEFGGTLFDLLGRNNATASASAPSWVIGPDPVVSGVYNDGSTNKWYEVAVAGTLASERDNVTLEVYARLDSIAGGERRMVVIENAGNLVGYGFKKDTFGGGGGHMCWHHQPFGSNFVQYTTDPTGWHHFVGTFRSSDGLMVAYLDGVQVGTTTAGAGQLADSSGQKLYILGGSQTTDNTKSFNGAIGWVRWWNRVLSAGEVSLLYARPFDMFETQLLRRWVVAAAGGPPATVIYRRTRSKLGTRMGSRQAA